MVSPAAIIGVTVACRVASEVWAQNLFLLMPLIRSQSLRPGLLHPQGSKLWLEMKGENGQKFVARMVRTASWHSTTHIRKISRDTSVLLALYVLHLQLDFFEAQSQGWSNQSAAQSVVKCTVSNPLHAHKMHLDPVLGAQSPHCAVIQQACKSRAIAGHE